MRRGQAWSFDLAVSLVVFLLASGLAYTMISNTLQDRSFEDVRKQANDASDLLSTEGFPAHWTEDSLIRAGLLANDRLSLRKTRLFPGLLTQDLRQSLRITDSFTLYILNASNDTIGLMGKCSVGDVAAVGTANTHIIPNMAFAAASHVADETDLDQYTGDDIFEPVRASDVVLLEGNISSATSWYHDKLRTYLEDISKNGITIIIVGDVGMNLLGTNIGEASAERFIANGTWDEMNLSDMDVINLSSSGPVLVPIMNIPTRTEVSEYTVVAKTENDDTGIATWLFNDARVWYFGTASGLKDDGRNITFDLATSINAMRNVSWPDCSALTIEPPSNAKQVARHDRTLAYHDQLLTVRTIVWRTR